MWKIWINVSRAISLEFLDSEKIEIWMDKRINQKIIKQKSTGLRFKK